ncbi:MAG: hypothetical protein ACXVAX_13075 [Pseudobdellovibrio sp.]
MSTLNKTPWEIGSVFICSKCGAKFNEPGLAEEVKSEVRKLQKAEGTQEQIRVIVSGCLGVCYPEKQTIAFMPVSGQTEIYTTELKKEVVAQEVKELLGRKLGRK